MNALWFTGVVLLAGDSLFGCLSSTLVDNYELVVASTNNL